MVEPVGDLSRLSRISSNYSPSEHNARELFSDKASILTTFLCVTNEPLPSQRSFENSTSRRINRIRQYNTIRMALWITRDATFNSNFSHSETINNCDVSSGNNVLAACCCFDAARRNVCSLDITEIKRCDRVVATCRASILDSSRRMQYVSRAVNVSQSLESCDRCVYRERTSATNTTRTSQCKLNRFD